MSMLLAATVIFSIILTIQVFYCARKNRYRLTTWYYKLKLARKVESKTNRVYDWDVYICYVHEDDAVLEEIRNFIEDKSNLKCCIPQRDFGASDTDDVTALEQSLVKSASTVVLWSPVALTSKWHCKGLFLCVLFYITTPRQVLLL